MRQLLTKLVRIRTSCMSGCFRTIFQPGQNFHTRTGNKLIVLSSRTSQLKNEVLRTLGQSRLFTPTGPCNGLTSAGIHSSPQCLSAVEDNKTKALTVLGSVKQVRTSPLPALTLGLAGLVPFVSAPLFMISSLTYLQHIATAQLFYGACILSFLGGVRWGFTIPEENPIKPDWTNLGYSVVPSLVAWVSLMLPHPAGVLTVIGGLMFAGYFDMAMYGYPGWFKGLRFLLSFIAVLSLWTTFMCSIMLPTHKTSKRESEGILS